MLQKPQYCQVRCKVKGIRDLKFVADNPKIDQVVINNQEYSVIRTGDANYIHGVDKNFAQKIKNEKLINVVTEVCKDYQQFYPDFCGTYPRVEVEEMDGVTTLRF